MPDASHAWHGLPPVRKGLGEMSVNISVCFLEIGQGNAQVKLREITDGFQDKKRRCSPSERASERPLPCSLAGGRGSRARPCISASAKAPHQRGQIFGSGESLPAHSCMSAPRVTQMRAYSHADLAVGRAALPGRLNVIEGSATEGTHPCQG